MMGAMGYLQSPADPLFWSHHVRSNALVRSAVCLQTLIDMFF